MNTEGSRFALPPEPYLPGRNTRPDESYFEASKRGLSSEWSVEALLASDALAHGIAAFRQNFFWEAHELFEAVWICLPPASAERLLMQGLIQLANARLKERMGQFSAAQRIFALADNCLAEALNRNATTGSLIASAGMIDVQSR